MNVGSERRAVRALLVGAILTTLLAVGVDAGAQERPGPADRPTEIKLSVGLLDVDDIHGATQNFSANVYFIARWKDERLAHDGKGSITMPLDEIWNPRLLILNRQKVFLSLPRVAEVAPDGTVEYQQRVWGQFSEPLSLRDFPLDQQDFHLLFVAAKFRADEVVFAVNEDRPSAIMEEFSLPDWDVLSWTAEPTIRPLVLGGKEISIFEFTFIAKRHAGYYLYKIIIPLFLIVAMSWIVFWIDPSQSSSQISVATTSMLTLIAYRFAIDALVPKVSYLTRMDLFILGSTLLVFMALLQAVWTSYVSNSGRSDRALAIDRACRVVFPVIFLLICAFAFYC